LCVHPFSSLFPPFFITFRRRRERERRVVRYDSIIRNTQRRRGNRVHNQRDGEEDASEGRNEISKGKGRERRGKRRRGRRERRDRDEIFQSK
jgi:hypothetical protein